MKASNAKFDSFAHELIAESLKKWAKNAQFVRDKLKQRLSMPEDDLDRKIAEEIKKNEEKEKGPEKKVEEPSPDKE